MTSSLAIVGYGVVGKAMHTLVPGAAIYDNAPDMPADRGAINKADIAFVCVPTPAGADGACDTSAVEDVVAWLTTRLIVLRSTVPPGTTDRLREKHGKRVVFQPEYLGETGSHPYADVRKRDFVILGGPEEDTSAVAEAYTRLYHSSIRFVFVDAVTAEVAKYMENCFFAAKVVFCGEFHRIAQAFGVDYHKLREAWLADGRISRDHTFVYPDKLGFGGKCLPKDLSGIIAAARQAGCIPEFLEAIEAINAKWQGEA